MIKNFKLKKHFCNFAALVMIISFTTVSLACKGEVTADDNKQSQTTNTVPDGGTSGGGRF